MGKGGKPKIICFFDILCYFCNKRPFHLVQIAFGKNLTKDILRIDVYPTLSPNLEDVLYTVDVLTTMVETCVDLYERTWPDTPLNKNQLDHYFNEYFSVEAFTHHFSIDIVNKEIDLETCLSILKKEFPQWVWTQVGTNFLSPKIRTLILEFIPIALTDNEWPFMISLEESLDQQKKAEYSVSEMKQRMSEMIGSVLGKEIVSVINLPKMQVFEERRTNIEKKLATRKRESEYQAIKEQQSAPNVKKKNRVAKMKDTDKISKIDSTHIALQEDAKRERASKERLRLANQKLELYVENLEASMIKNSIQYLNALSVDEDEKWHKRYKISLKEYTYLFQKAKYLEQMWRINDNLIQKIEKMTLNNNELVYERGQTKEILDNHLSAKDISLVFYECSVIESRVKINERPWFQKPYVRMMKMDYDNLLRKSAYFDLLQGESYLIEQKISVTQTHM